MDFAQLKELLHLVDVSDLREFELNTDQVAVRMSKNSHSTFAQLPSNEETSEHSLPVSTVETKRTKETTSLTESSEPESSTSATEESGHVLEAPIVGVVYLSSSPDKPVFKKTGDSVKKGETLCIIEAMKVMNEIKSDKDGTLQEVLVEDGQAIEYGQPLFRIKEEE